MAERIRVLLVDDDPNDAEEMKDSLTRGWGGEFEFHCVERISSALDRLESGGIDAAILDLTLPDSMGLDGLERLSAKHRNLPIVVMTGLDDQELAVTALQRGAQDYLVKGRVQPENLARALRHAAARKDLDRLREDLFHNVNHELRAPLSSVLGAVDLLLSGPLEVADPRGKAVLEIAARGLRNLVSMTEDMAQVLESETGQLSIKRARVDPRPLVEESLALLRLMPAAAGLNLSADLPDDLPHLRTDPGRLRQILGNLLGNAVKATPRGGSITVRARPWSAAPGFVCVAVADTGCGIPPEMTDGLFTRLHRGQAGGGYRRGLGIGLFLCRELVTRQGGKIWVESEPGRGSTVSFTLPADDS